MGAETQSQMPNWLNPGTPKGFLFAGMLSPRADLWLCFAVKELEFLLPQPHGDSLSIPKVALLTSLWPLRYSQVASWFLLLYSRETQVSTIHCNLSTKPQLNLYILCSLWSPFTFNLSLLINPSGTEFFFSPPNKPLTDFSVSHDGT